MRRKKERLTSEWLLERARQFNEDMHKAVWESESLPLQTIVLSVNVIAERIYQRQPHWHYFAGRCMKPVPFEINMEALALLAATWVADIFLRKARDRSTSAMEHAYQDWRGLLESTLDYVNNEVKSTRDPDAEAAWERDRRPVNRVRCLINRLLWRH